MGNALFVHGGVTSAKEARLALAGLLTLQGPTALDVRTGVLVGPGSTTLVTGTSATAPMQVAIGVHDGVTSRGIANGPYLMATEAVQLVNIGAAPGSGTRIDVVYEKQVDPTPGVPGADTGFPAAPLYGVKVGTVGAGKPDLSTIVGAEELATVAVSAGATATNGPNVLITNTARQTVARGGVLPVATEAEATGLTPYPGLTVYAIATKAIGVHDGTRWLWWDSGPQTYTPTLGAGVAPGTGGSAVNKGEYTRQGRRTHLRLTLVFGPTGPNFGTPGVAWTWSLPPGHTIATALASEQVLPAKVSATGYISNAAWAYGVSSTTLGVSTPTAYNSATVVSKDTPITAASGSVVISGFFDNQS